MVVHQCDYAAGMEPWTEKVSVLRDCCCRETDASEVGSILGGPMECLSNIYSPCHPHLWTVLGWPMDPTCFSWQNMIVSFWTYFPFVCLIIISPYVCFVRPLKLDGSAKGCLARNVFMTIKIAALCKWQGAGLERENSFAVTILRFAVVRCESVI